MRHTLHACLILSLVAAGSAYALDAGEEALVGSIEALYGPERMPAAPVSAPRAPESAQNIPENMPHPEGADHEPVLDPNAVHRGCGSALLRQAFNQWESLSPEAKARLQPLMDPPGGIAPNGSPAAPDSSWSTAESAHFHVSWKASGDDAPPLADANGNHVPDYIDNALVYLEKAYDFEVKQLGFIPPPDGKEVIFFKKLNHNGLTHPMPGKKSWIELSSDILGFTKRVLGKYYNPTVVSHDPAGPEAGLLKAVCAHEYFHAVQAQYSWGQPAWWAEGTADWMGNQVFPESGFYLNNVGPHLEQPYASLFLEGDFMQYSASLFPTFISENLGASKVKDIWDAVKSTPLEQALANNLGDLPEFYLNYACYNAVRNYKDGQRMPMPQMNSNEDYPATLTPPAGREPQYYGASIFRLVPRRPGTLHVEFAPADRGDVRARLIIIDRGNTTWNISRVRAGADRRLVADVQGFGDQYSQVLVVVGSFSPNAKGHFDLKVDVR